jgi:hypothetical protein
MSFNLEVFNQQLSAFGTVDYSAVVPSGECDCLEFVCIGIDTQYALANISGLFDEILPHFPILITISIDTNRVKGAFKRMN